MSDIPKSMLGHFCNREQYAMLLRCSERKDMAEWNAWRRSNHDVEVHLQGADFTNAYCRNADFGSAHFEGADFTGAHCEGADFKCAHFEGATFWYAHCEGANFYWTNCEWTHFDWAHCEGAVFKCAHFENAQFDFAHFERMNSWNAHFEGADFKCAHFEDANFDCAHCEKADFHGAYCEGAVFKYAHCEGAEFWYAYCEGADFHGAHCEGANFHGMHCEGVDFSSAQFSSSTQFLRCSIDDTSDFSYTALGSIMVEPAKRVRMEYNIRRFAWAKWYKEQENSIQRVSLVPICPKIGKMLSSLLIWFYLGPVKFFWHVSDYGYSTTRVIKWFFRFVVLFTSLYTFFPWMLMLNNKVMDITNTNQLPGHVFQMLAFATSTMVTLGFGNINVSLGTGETNFIGMIVVTCNLIMGYFMLAVLVTRLGILFQSQGPGEPRSKKDK